MEQAIMKIDIVWGRSEGKTLLSAFDKALVKAGIHNFNLIPLSSVIPQNSVVEEVGKVQMKVISHRVEEIANVTVAAVYCNL